MPRPGRPTHTRHSVPGRPFRPWRAARRRVALRAGAPGDRQERLPPELLVEVDDGVARAVVVNDGARYHRNLAPRGGVAPDEELGRDAEARLETVERSACEAHGVGATEAADHAGR